MAYTQEFLNEQWRIWKERPPSEYAECRITEDSDLIQGLEFDMTSTYGDSVDSTKVIAFTRRRGSVDTEWSAWEEGRSASV